MEQGFVKVAAATPRIKVADCEYNRKEIIRIMRVCERKQVKIVVFPELCVTGYTCGDLFLQSALLNSAMEELGKIIKVTEKMDLLAFVGVPIMMNGNLYNGAAVIKGGELLGVITKKHIPNYSEFYETRYFSEGSDETSYNTIEIGEQIFEDVPIGVKLLFHCDTMPDLVIGADICEDVWVTIPPSSYHVLAGATVIVNLSASDEVTGKDVYRRNLICSQSARAVCGYIYADAGEGESSTDLVFSGHNLIVENGFVLAEAERFTNDIVITELDMERIISERRKNNTFQCQDPFDVGYDVINFEYEKVGKTPLSRTFAKLPFVPEKEDDRTRCFDEILKIQAMGLKKRLYHTGCTSAVIGISGGLDSTLALLVTIKAFDMLKMSREDIIAITMPCFGTTDRTYQNAFVLMKELGVTIKEINIEKSVKLHLEQIGHDIKNHDITFENAQARERTQILMDIANFYNALVIGTGDMSELALGWATYNGDHMSMYGVNASVPKTLVRYLVSYCAETSENKTLKNVLLDVVDTPVSPELLPPKEGAIAQKTEDIVGPYELHDFFLYYMIRYGFSPAKIFNLAVTTFESDYGKETIYHWLYIFYRRFFSQQFKRSCLPDGPKVGSVALSPRGDWRMPSDACVSIWLKELESVKKEYSIK